MGSVLLRETAADGVSPAGIVRIGSFKDISQFEAHLRALNLNIPYDRALASSTESSLLEPLSKGRVRIASCMAVQPMGGWDATAGGNASENTVRRWRRFGQTGGKLIWGGEAVAVSDSGRANPHQLVAAPRTEKGLAKLRSALVEEHQ